MVGIVRYRKKPEPPYRFRSPRHVPFFMWLAYTLTPYFLHRFLRISRIEVAQEDLEALRRLGGQRVVLTPNHPTADPIVLFQLSRRLGLKFCWMAARELFDARLQGAVVSRVGVYSIDRGRRDEQSLSMTQQILCEGQHWVVIFPEGVNHLLHNEVLPFLPGAARQGFGALDLLGSQGGELPPVYLQPVALRYYYLQDMRQTALKSLERLERRLGLDVRPARPLQHRLGVISNLVLELNERHYGIMPRPGDDEDSRLNRLKEIALQRVAEGMGMDVPSPDQPLRNRVRKLLNASNQLLAVDAAAGGSYAHELSVERRERVLKLRHELSRISTFMAMRWNYEVEAATIENLMDVLNLLEMDLLGRKRVWGPRGVLIKVGAPIDLREHYSAYHADPVAACEAVMLQVEIEVRRLLKTSADRMAPIPLSMVFG